MCADLHSCDFYLTQVGAPLGQIPRLKAAADRKGGLVVIHPFSGSSRKNWPLENFRAVARALPSPVEFTAGPEEQLPEARRFERLDHLAAYLATADLYIGNDSGVSHLAAAVGTPTIVLFRTTNPALWAPRSTAAVVVLQGDPEPSQVIAAANALLTSAGVTLTKR
jgi:ADP-heptose:LPS heptosyltransferase